MASNNNGVLGWIAAGIFGIGLVAVSDKNRKLKDKNDILMKANQSLRDQLKEINKQFVKLKQESGDNLPVDIIENLEGLISDFENLDKAFADELKETSSLLISNLTLKAVFSLSKVIENLLKKILKSKGKFEILIKQAEDKSILSREECSFVHGIRKLRNKEAHELKPEVDSYLTEASLNIGYNVVAKLKLKIQEG